MERISVDLEEVRELGMQLRCWEIIRTNFEHRWVIVCWLHRHAEGIWPCYLNQIVAYPKRNWYWLAHKKIDRQIVRGSDC
jgi:hypothetical protein